MWTMIEPILSDTVMLLMGTLIVRVLLERRKRALKSAPLRSASAAARVGARAGLPIVSGLTDAAPMGRPSPRAAGQRPKTCVPPRPKTDCAGMMTLRKTVQVIGSAGRLHRNGHSVDFEKLAGMTERHLKEFTLDDLARISASLCNLVESQNGQEPIFRQLAAEAHQRLAAQESCCFRSLTSLVRAMATILPRRPALDELDEFQVLFRTIYAATGTFREDMTTRDLLAIRGAFGHVQVLTLDQWNMLQHRIVAYLDQVREAGESTSEGCRASDEEVCSS